MTKTARTFFIILFFASTLFAAGLALMSFPTMSAPAAGETSEPVPVPTQGGGQNIVEDPNKEEKPAAVAETNFALLSAVATSLASLVGFVTTTVITWRKEKREADLASMERKKLELELEKSRLELEELKKEKKK